ncbi:MAG: glycosyl transferase, partial [Actinobacteria bacterium]|nr:glycosyl transferase [Actinomycetota bacterium]
ELRDPALPPTFSGLATEDRSGWLPFRTHYRDLHRQVQHDFSEWCREECGLPLPEPEFMLESPYLNMYIYPRELDYPRSTPLAPTWHRIESSVRTTDEDFTLPPELATGDGKLIYLSLGSLGSADVELMQRLIGMLSRSHHRVIVSMGPQHELIELADNMWGSEFLPQTKILPLVDLVITHGGNNTVTESMHFGKPMLVLPLFWDQHDNARRVQETGYGVHLATYQFSELEFFTALDGLLSDDDLRARMAQTAERLQANPGTQQAADLIWRLAETKQPVVD